MSVVGNELILSSRCNYSYNEKIIIYELNSDGTITLNKKLRVLYTAFNTPFVVPLQNCLDPSFNLPPNNFTSFMGTLDEISGFIFFNRSVPIQEDAPIINEGIALEVYYNNIGRRPSINFFLSRFI